jgi:streptogramin lyase
MWFSVFQAAVLLSSSLVAAAPAPEASAAASDSKFTYFEMPTALAGPCNLCTGPDGAIWVQDILVDKIARIDPDTGDVEDFDIPYDGPGLQGGALLGIPDTLLNRSALACALQPGHDGNIYAASGHRNQFSRINPTTKKIDVFTPNPPAPLGDVLFLNDLYAHPDGVSASLSCVSEMEAVKND